MRMSVTKETVELIKQFEGCVLKVYLDPVGIPTAGYGHTLGLTIDMVGKPITQAQAEQWLKEDLIKFEKKVDKYDPIYHWTSKEKSALISFAYNVGNIDGLTAKGTRTKKEIADSMLSYNKAKGKVLKGLTRRREAERQMFLQVVSIDRPTLRRGCSGNAVKELQRLLGFSEKQIDGIFGYATETAVKIYQTDKGLIPDGCCGQKTWAKLLGK